MRSGLHRAHPAVKKNRAHRCAGFRGALATIIVSLAACAAGCSLFHHGVSPQQKFLEDLNRGNAAEASQLWLTMKPRDRANLSHSVGFTSHVSADDIKAQLFKHEREKAAEQGDDVDTELSESNEGDINSEQIELPGLDFDPKADGLSNLPYYNLPGPVPASSNESH